MDTVNFELKIVVYTLTQIKIVIKILTKFHSLGTCLIFDGNFLN